MKKGWPVTRLGDLTDLVTKGTTPTSIGHEFVEEGINFVKVESITTTGQFIEEKFAHITPACHAVLGRSQLQAGDILFSIAGALGRTGFVTDDILPANTNQALAIIRLKRDVGVSPKFVLKALETGVVLEQIEKFKGGVAQQNLSLAQVRDFQIALPPLAEQQRIVGLLDEAFAGLATAKANAEKNLQNARALFESHLQSVFTQRGPGWVEKRLEEVCGLQNGFAFKSSTFKPSGAPILRISNIQDGRIEAGNRLVFFDPKDYRENLDRYRIVEDDLLIAMSGATTGKLGFNTESTVYYLNQRVGKFEPSEKLNKRFLYHFLSTKVEENLRISAGAAQPNLSTEQIKGFVLPLPSVDEQERIVEALETLAEETQRLARLYERKHAALEALKKSLLHQAFTGAL